MQHQALPGELLETEHRARRGSFLSHDKRYWQLVRNITPPNSILIPELDALLQDAAKARTSARVVTLMACFARAMSLLLLVAATDGFQKPSDRMPSDLHGPRPLPDDPDALAAVQQSITEHDEHHRNVCKYQFCGPVEKVAPLEYDLYPVGMPSVDYPDALEAANAQIHVSRTPLFTAEEMERVIELAEEEGVASRGDPTQAARASMKYGSQGQVSDALALSP